MQDILKYFPDLTERQVEQFEMLGPLYEHWNDQINVISRKDIEELYSRHVLHSLAIAKAIQFKPFTKILDVGTGGGFPGIPLAILFPKSQFLLVDSIGKKIKVVQEVVSALGLENVTAKQNRMEEIEYECDFVVARAVARLVKLHRWTRKHIVKGDHNALQNGWLLLKGGDLTDELKEVRTNSRLFPIADFFENEFFAEKYVIHLRK